MSWWFECQSCDFRTVEIGEALNHAKANKSRWTHRWYAHLVKVVQHDDSESGDTAEAEAKSDDFYRPLSILS